MPTTEDFIDASWRVVPAFDLAPTSITLLSHSENVVCELTHDDGSRQVLRLHRPGYNTLAQLNSEVQWVKALGEYGIPVPTAVATPGGEHYVQVDVAGDPHYVGVVDWIQGAPLGGPTQAGSSDVVAHYGQIGQLAAQIRMHNQTWSPPAGFTRRSWDVEGFLGAGPLWGRFWEIPILADDDRALFAACRTALHKELSSLPRTSDYFGLIHSDLHLGNLMADGDALTVIDFDDAGFGWFAHELAVALHPVLDEPWEAEARAALFGGYRRVCELSDHQEQLVDTFLTMRCMMIMGWLDARKELPVYELFPELVTQATAAAYRYLGRA